MEDKDRIEAIRAHYEHRLSAQRENHEVLDWASADSQLARFEVLAENVPLGGRSLLDVGCGLGDLLGFLRQHRIDADYTGVDVLEKMVDASRARFPTGRFVRADIFRGDRVEPGAFDVVFTSGIFNLNLGNNLAFLPAAVRTFFALSREHVVFNLLHARSPVKDDGYFFYEPEQVLATLRAYPCEVRLIDDYLPNDFTVVCRRTGDEADGAPASVRQRRRRRRRP